MLVFQTFSEIGKRQRFTRDAGLPPAEEDGGQLYWPGAAFALQQRERNDIVL